MQPAPGPPMRTLVASRWSGELQCQLTMQPMISDSRRIKQPENVFSVTPPKKEEKKKKKQNGSLETFVIGVGVGACWRWPRPWPYCSLFCSPTK